jgi:5-hydroxyisourate hydrolase-like protein (transthyretin family)
MSLPTKRFQQVIALMLLAGAVVSCSSHPLSGQYVSPRLTGRVLDMEDGRPLKGVRVRRLTPEENSQTLDQHGGNRLQETASETRTGGDGRFVMESVRTLNLIGTYGWYSVTLAFEQSGYQRIARSYSLTDSTNTPSGEPLVDTGDVRLPKRSR